DELEAARLDFSADNPEEDWDLTLRAAVLTLDRRITESCIEVAENAVLSRPGAAWHIPTRAAESARQCRLIHCIFGNPFRSVVIEPTWLTPAVVGLAGGIDEGRAFDRMPILGD